MHKKSFSGCLYTGHPIFMLPATVYNQFLKMGTGTAVFFWFVLFCFFVGVGVVNECYQYAVYFMR